MAFILIRSVCVSIRGNHRNSSACHFLHFQAWRVRDRLRIWQMSHNSGCSVSFRALIYLLSKLQPNKAVRKKKKQQQKNSSAYKFSNFCISDGLAISSLTHQNCVSCVIAMHFYLASVSLALILRKSRVMASIYSSQYLYLWECLFHTKASSEIFLWRMQMWSRAQMSYQEMFYF